MIVSSYILFLIKFYIKTLIDFVSEKLKRPLIYVIDGLL
jgi:hypothetical protein